MEKISTLREQYSGSPSLEDDDKKFIAELRKKGIPEQMIGDLIKGLESEYDFSTEEDGTLIFSPKNNQEKSTIH